MKISYLFLPSLLLGSPLLGVAQQATAPTYGRYYVGLAAYASDYQGIGGNSFRELRAPVQLTAGYQLLPRLAVQAGLAYKQDTFDYGTLSFVEQDPRAIVARHQYFGQANWYHTSLSLLARYTLTRRATHRLQVDLLGGFTLEKERAATSYQYTTFDGTGAVFSSSTNTSAYRYSVGQLTAGLSARYRCTPHLDAVLDATLNSPLSRLESPPSLAGALGLRYRFGQL
ncbi:outer membrane beta-barrel protein [Hymenobacter sp. H14-R3]|uniref:outer membrane beta-barrel protein n=1 Tax=Hymenobacter sp. H14-R3 TaxID=3046308 RepID=UPI0024B9ABEB|nr:outer membrane beta-barrel protein [Hymenobacter sp. H14-R3]MDJ0364617.1 outer membrane beta-barrel protein [Hymenobacter sp. H14-R3]